MAPTKNIRDVCNPFALFLEEIQTWEKFRGLFYFLRMDIDKQDGFVYVKPRNAGSQEGKKGSKKPVPVINKLKGAS